MPAQPNLDRFTQLATQFDVIPVYRRLLSDTLTPVSAFRLLDDGRSAALFESVIGGEKVGRYSFIAVGAQSRLTATRNQLTVTRTVNGQPADETSQVADPLESLWEFVSEKKVAKLSELPPFSGGAFGFASYDVVRYVEDLPNAPKDDRGLPDIDFSIFDDPIIFDNVNKSLFVAALLTRLHRNRTSIADALTSWLQSS
ncbi:MAG: hypothetical protein U0930_09805 [Pirellulales bacterium]